MNKAIYFVFCISFFFIYSCSDDDSKDGSVDNSKPDVSVVRDKVTKAATFNIDETTQDWKLYVGNTISSIDVSKPILEGKGKGSFSLNVSNSTRFYFQLVTADGSTTYVAESLLPLEGGYNFRDLGGIKTMDNKSIKWGILFRSGDLSELTPEDLTYLSSIPLITQADFRSLQEIESAPNKRPSSLKNIYELSISFGDLNFDISSLDTTIIDGILVKQNIQLVSDSVAVNNYKKLFILLQNENNLPLIYNCTAGKDRTGMATALILYALGVDEDVIFKNYLESNIYIGDKYANSIAVYPFLKPLFEVRTEYLGSGIDYIKNNYGSVENYLVNVLNVDLNLMKSIYLY